MSMGPFLMPVLSLQQIFFCSRPFSFSFLHQDLTQVAKSCCPMGSWLNSCCPPSNWSCPYDISSKQSRKLLRNLQISMLPSRQIGKINLVAPDNFLWPRVIRPLKLSSPVLCTIPGTDTCYKYPDQSPLEVLPINHWPWAATTETTDTSLIAPVRGFWSWFGGVCSLTYCNGNFRVTMVSEPFNVIL